MRCVSYTRYATQNFQPLQPYHIYQPLQIRTLFTRHSATTRVTIGNVQTQANRQPLADVNREEGQRMKKHIRVCEHIDSDASGYLEPRPRQWTVPGWSDSTNPDGH